MGKEHYISKKKLLLYCRLQTEFEFENVSDWWYDISQNIPTYLERSWTAMSKTKTSNKIVISVIYIEKNTHRKYF